MAAEKAPIEPTKALEQKTPEAPKKRFKFQKTMAPGETVKVGEKEIVFHRATNNRTGRLSPCGTYETEDESFAKALVELARKNPSLHIFAIN